MTNEHHVSEPARPVATGTHSIIYDLQLRPGANNEEQLEQAMRGHLPRKGELVGKYSRQA
jgi:hypothetical protein